MPPGGGMGAWGHGRHGRYVLGDWREGQTALPSRGLMRSHWLYGPYERTFPA